MMSNETKRDVLKGVVETLHTMDGAPDEYCKELIGRYDAALPDDIPVIPEAVGELLRSAYGQTTLLDVLETAKKGRKISDPLAWVFANQNTFANAWLLGVWRVEETGEIVKMDDLAGVLDSLKVEENIDD